MQKLKMVGYNENERHKTVLQLSYNYCFLPFFTQRLCWRIAAMSLTTLFFLALCWSVILQSKIKMKNMSTLALKRGSMSQKVIKMGFIIAHRIDWRERPAALTSKNWTKKYPLSLLPGNQGTLKQSHYH